MLMKNMSEISSLVCGICHHAMTLMRWCKTEVGCPVDHPSNKITYFQYLGSLKILLQSFMFFFLKIWRDWCLACLGENTMFHNFVRRCIVFTTVVSEARLNDFWKLFLSKPKSVTQLSLPLKMREHKTVLIVQFKEEQSYYKLPKLHQLYELKSPKIILWIIIYPFHYIEVNEKIWHNSVLHVHKLVVR